ncbi:uncharacterized [Tachysurus ichikawai]
MCLSSLMVAVGKTHTDIWLVQIHVEQERESVVEGKRKREWIEGVGVWGLMRTCCRLPICQQRLWSLSAAGTHQFPQVWILLEQDLCSSHGKELVPLTPTLLNGTQKGKDREGGGKEGERVGESEFPGPHLQSQAALHHGNLALFLRHAGDVDCS